MFALRSLSLLLGALRCVLCHQVQQGAWTVLRGESVRLITAVRGLFGCIGVEATRRVSCRLITECSIRHLDMSKEQQLKYMNMRWQQMASEQTMDYLQRMSPEQQKWFLGPLSTSQAGASDPAEQEVQEDSLSAVIRRLSIAERELEMEQMRVLYIGHYVKVLYILLGIPCVTIACTSPIVVFAPKNLNRCKSRVTLDVVHSPHFHRGFLPWVGNSTQRSRWRRCVRQCLAQILTQFAQ